jgi:hypothetical protein
MVYLPLQVIHGKQHFMTTHGKVRSQVAATIGTCMHDLLIQ